MCSCVVQVAQTCIYNTRCNVTEAGETSSTRVQHLEEDLGRHGEAVGDDWLLVWRLPLPAVQLQAAAAGQQALAVHLRGRHAGELARCERHTTTVFERGWVFRSPDRHVTTPSRTWSAHGHAPQSMLVYILGSFNSHFSESG